MPLLSSKWQLDNFFIPGLFMDLPRNLHDCYFYYYSTCKKGSNCEYRHEPAALGHEETCKLWVEGKCYNRQCTMRHMKIEKPRNATPCYWEDQPGGCRKPHCVFQHKMPKQQQQPPPLQQQQQQPPHNVVQVQPSHLVHSATPAVVLDYNYALLPRIM